MTTKDFLKYKPSVKTKSPKVIDFHKYIAKYWQEFDNKEFQLDKLCSWENIWAARQKGFEWCLLCEDKGKITNSRGLTTNCPRCNYKDNLMSLANSDIEEVARWYQDGENEELLIRLPMGELALIRGEDVNNIVEVLKDEHISSTIQPQENDVYCVYFDVLETKKYKTKISNFENGEFDIWMEPQKGTYFPSLVSEIIIFKLKEKEKV